MANTNTQEKGRLFLLLFFGNTKTEMMKMEMENEALEIWDVRAKEEERGFLGNTNTKTKKC